MNFRLPIKIISSLLPKFTTKYNILENICHFDGYSNVIASSKVLIQKSAEILKIPAPALNINFIGNNKPTHNLLTCTTNIVWPTVNKISITAMQQRFYSSSRSEVEANKAAVRAMMNCDKRPRVKKLVFRQTTIDECKECFDPPAIDKSPKLCRPRRTYDPSKMKYAHPQCVPICETHPKRSDDIVGYKTERKTLPPIIPDPRCGCYPELPYKCPKLRRPTMQFDYNQMKFRHPQCEDLCDIDPPRMDNVCGVKVVPKTLPKLPESDTCLRCYTKFLKQGCKLKRPKRRYDPSTLTWHSTNCENLCDLDPPRMDDVLCWKPTIKILPSFLKKKC